MKRLEANMYQSNAELFLYDEEGKETPVGSISLEIEAFSPAEGEEKRTQEELEEMIKDDLIDRIASTGVDVTQVDYRSVLMKILISLEANLSDAGYME